MPSPWCLGLWRSRKHRLFIHAALDMRLLRARGTSMYKMLADEAELQVWREIEVAFPSGHREAGVNGAG